MDNTIGASLGIEVEEDSKQKSGTPAVADRPAPQGVGVDELTKLSEETLYDGFIDLKQIADHSTAMAMEIFASIDGIEERSKPRYLEVASQLMKSSIDAIKQSQDAAFKQIERAEKTPDTPPPSTGGMNNQFNFFGNRNDLMELLASGGMKNITGEK